MYKNRVKSVNIDFASTLLAEAMNHEMSFVYKMSLQTGIRCRIKYPFN